MSRLTRWNGSKWVLPQGIGAFREVADRLAAYENTGIEPEEMRALQRGFGCVTTEQVKDVIIELLHRKERFINADLTVEDISEFTKGYTMALGEVVDMLEQLVGTQSDIKINLNFGEELEGEDKDESCS